MLVVRRTRKKRATEKSTKERVLQLAEIIASADRSSEVFQEAKRKLAEHFKELDIATLKDIVERNPEVLTRLHFEPRGHNSICQMRLTFHPPAPNIRQTL